MSAGDGAMHSASRVRYLNLSRAYSRSRSQALDGAGHDIEHIEHAGDCLRDHAVYPDPVTMAAGAGNQAAAYGGAR